MDIFGVPRAEPANASSSPWEPGSYRSVAAVPCRKVCRLVNVACPYWLSARVSFERSRWNQTPTREFVAAFGVGNAVFVREQVARNPQVASVVASRQAELSGGIRSRAASHHDRAHRISGQETGQGGRGRARGGLAGEEISRPGIADARRVEQRGGKDMRFLDARHLLSETFHIRAVEVGAGGSEVGAVIDRVDGRSRCLSGKTGGRAARFRSRPEWSAAGC